MLNLTNPLTVLTRVVGLTTPRQKVMGLCHELFGVRGALIRMFGGSEQDFEMRVAGVNHLIWLLDMTIRGQDGLQMVRDFVRQGREVPLPPSRGDWHEPFVDRWKLKLELFDVYGALPAAGDRHLAEFFPYFLTEATQRGADYGVLLTTIPHRREQVASARADVRAAIEGELPTLSRSPEATADIVSAVANGRSVRTIVNLRGRGDGLDWYEAEARACQALGLAHENLTFSASRLPARRGVPKRRSLRSQSRLDAVSDEGLRQRLSAVEASNREARQGCTAKASLDYGAQPWRRIGRRLCLRLDRKRES